MHEADVSLTRSRLKTPRAAAIAGILFALLFGTSMVLIRISIPADPTADSAWLQANSTRITLALNLAPYAGIAFLWFIGVIRDRLGDQEDRLFATVFLGSGLLFLALVFVGAASAGALLVSIAAKGGLALDNDVYLYNRAAMHQIMNIYAIRMAGLFMMSLSTIWLRTGLMHRGWAFVTYALAFILLVSISLSLWVILIFPGWVFLVSTIFLIQNLRHPSEEPPYKATEA